MNCRNVFISDLTSFQVHFKAILQLYHIGIMIFSCMEHEFMLWFYCLEMNLKTGKIRNVNIFTHCCKGKGSSCICILIFHLTSRTILLFYLYISWQKHGPKFEFEHLKINAVCACCYWKIINCWKQEYRDNCMTFAFPTREVV